MWPPLCYLYVCMRLVGDDLLFHLRHASELVLLVAELRFEACLADALLNAVGGEAVRCACCADHVFFDHNRAEVVGASVESYLCYFSAYCEPGGLYVLYVG